MASTPTPNYINPETRGKGSLIAVIILTVLAICFVSARLYARFFILRRPGMDDYVIIPAMVVVIANVVDSLLAIERFGWNKHIWDIRPEERHKTFLLLWLSHHLYIGSVGLIKISILFFYLRVISGSQNKTMSWIIIGTIIFVVAFTFSFIVGFIFICRPVQAYYMQYNRAWKEANRFKCAYSTGLTETGTSLNSITDFWITLLPLLFIRKLHMHRKQKWALAILFSCGFLVSISSVIRAVFTFKLKRTDNRDVTWQGYFVITWSQIEPLVALMCASTPALKIYFREYFSSDSYAAKYRYSSYGLGKKGYRKSSGKGTGNTADGDMFEMSNETERVARFEWDGRDGSTAKLAVPDNAVVKSTTIDVSTHAAT